MSGARCRECGSEAEISETFARLESEIEEFGDAFKLRSVDSLVGEVERNGLRKAARSFDEEKLGVEFSIRFGDAAEREIGGDLREVFRVVAPEFTVINGKRAHDSFDFTQDDATLRGEYLVDATVEGYSPTVMNDLATNRDFEFGVSSFCDDLLTDFVVPLRAKLCAPDSLLKIAAGPVGADGEV